MLPGPPTPEKRAVRGSNATGGSSPAANQRDAEQQGAGQRSLDRVRPAAGPQDAERVGLGLPGTEQQAAAGGVDPRADGDDVLRWRVQPGGGSFG